MQGLNMPHRLSLIILYKGCNPGEAFWGTVYPTFWHSLSMVSLLPVSEVKGLCAGVAANAGGKGWRLGKFEVGV